MITCHQIIARNRSGSTVITPIDRVIRDGVQVGTIARVAGAPFCPLAGITEEDAASIVKGIAEFREREGSFGPPAETAAKTYAGPIEAMIERGEIDPDKEDDDV